MEAPRFWQQLTAAPPGLRGATRRQTRLLSALLLVLIPFAALAILVESILNPGAWATLSIMFGALTALCAAYVLGRRGHYAVAAILTVGVVAVSCFAAVLVMPTDAFAYAFLAVSLILAWLLLTQAGLIITTAAVLGTTLLLALLRVDPLHTHPIGASLFLLIVSALLLLGRRHRDAIARERRAELEASEARYRNVVELAHEGIWQLDAQQRTVFASPQMASLLGYETEELYRAPLGDFVDAESRNALAQFGRQEGASAKEQELKLRRKDGNVIWTLVKAMPLLDDAGRYAGALALFADITERRRAEAALRESEERYRSVVAAMTEGVVIQDADGRVVACNPSAERILGLSADQLMGRTSTDPSWRAIREDGSPFPGDAHPAMVTLRTARPQTDVIMGVHRPDGSLVWISINSQPLRHAGDAQPFAVVTSFADITARRRTEEQTRKLSSAIEQTADAVLISDTDGVIEYVNPAFERVTGYRAEEVLGKTPALLKSGQHGPWFYRKLWETLGAGGAYSDVFVNRRKDGSLYYEETTISPLKDAKGCITHFVSTGKDVTERMQIQERMQHMAQHDALTDLPNRALLLDRMGLALARARRHKRLVALLFIDLDRFKNINDSLGHEAGDQLLRQLARRFRQCLREDDIVARFGGDEFAILLDDVAHENDVRTVAQKALQALAPPFEIEHRRLYISASIGVSLFPTDGTDSGMLLRNADIAMYRAKELGKNTFQFYSAEMSARAFERLTLETNLRYALERGEFRLYYQPQVDIGGGTIVGAEALLRWQHPDLGLVMPADFTPLLEETGLIVPTGEWVMREAFRQLRAWDAAGCKPLRLCINLSARQFTAADLAQRIASIVEECGVAPERIEFEITESVLMQQAPTTLETLSRLKALGCRLAIDDFGTGYSSLAYLKRFPIDVLKVDRSFVRDVPENADDMAIVSAIVAMAHTLKLDVVAEGVETVKQLEFLRTCACTAFQGFLVSQATPADSFAELLARSAAV